MVIFPSTMTEGRKENYSSESCQKILDSLSLPFPTPILFFTLVCKNFIDQDHKEDFWEESTCAQLPAYVCVLCFQLFPYDQREILKVYIMMQQLFSLA